MRRGSSGHMLKERRYVKLIQRCNSLPQGGGECNSQPKESVVHDNQRCNSHTSHKGGKDDKNGGIQEESSVTRNL